MRILPITVLTICLLLISAYGQTPTEENFLEDFEEVKTLMAKRKWSQAEKRLKDLLEAHQNEDYVRVRRVEIEECMKKCLFRASFKEPELKTLISGELLSYKASSGDIKMRYTPKGMGDFERDEKEESGIKFLIYTHPAMFAGPYTIEIKGSSYPPEKQRAMIHCCCSAEGIYTVQLEPPRLMHSTKDQYDYLDFKKSSPATEGKAFRIRVKVGKSHITAYVNNKQLLKTKKPISLYGYFGLTNLPFDEMLIKGKVQPSWLQGLSDKKEQEARLEFEKGYRAGHHLPPWLFEKKVAKSAKKRKTSRVVPGPDLRGQDEYVAKALEYLDDKQFRSGLRYVAKLSGGDITTAAREYLQAMFLKGLMKYEEAMDHCRHASELDPDCLSLRKLHASLLASLRMDEEAEKEYSLLLEEFPEEVELYLELAKLLLHNGNPTDAKEVVDQAVHRNLANFELNLLNKILTNAMNGPAWDKKFDYKSKHYHVFSDIDRKTCLEASKILEESYVSYMVYLERVPNLEKDKFPVYLFSGQKGYMMYLADMQMPPSENSLGVYIPSLRQMLIWNAPDREAMMRTVRHEGFHQYFHRLVKDPPIWLNEGLAEYYEIAYKERGKWKLGSINKAHKRLLTDSDTVLIPLEEFLYQDHEVFMRKAEINYAQSWAFVNFLRQATREKRKLFEKLFKILQRNIPTRAALEEAFEGVDLDKLEAEFKKYIRDMKWESLGK